MNAVSPQVIRQIDRWIDDGLEDAIFDLDGTLASTNIL